MIRSFRKISFAASAALPLLLLAPRGESQGAGPVQAAASAPLTHISVTSAGEGAPVVFIPGLASPRAVFSSAAAALASSHRVYLVQVNGFGGDAPGGNLEPGMLEGIVADLHAYLQSNHLQHVVVVGHSMGGLVGLMLSKEHPEDTGKLVIVDALPYVGDIFLPGAQVAQVEPQAKMMRAMMVATYGKPLNPAMAQKTADSQALHADARAQVADWVSKADPRVTGEALYEDMTTDLRPDMKTVQTPITLVYPYSAEMPKEKADSFYRAEYAAAPHVTYVPVPDSGHFVMLDQPQVFQRVLTEALASR